MKTAAIRLALAASVIAAALAMVAPLQTGEAHAASRNDHPDLAWWPAGEAQSNKLFVGGLSWDTTGATAEFNPKEISVDMPVPWQR